MEEYYYNNVPEIGLCRNNLVYTAKVDKSVNLFICHYTTDQTYHDNQCLSENLLEEKWQRDLKFSLLFFGKYERLMPKIRNIDQPSRKIFYEYQDVDFWQQADCNKENYSKVLPDWQEQMLDILKAYRSIGVWKYSLHPSSYFIIDGTLRSVNHFFCYSNDESEITISQVLNHISKNRQEKLLAYCKENDINITATYPFEFYGQLTLESFRGDYPDEFIDKAKLIYT